MRTYEHGKNKMRQRGAAAGCLIPSAWKQICAHRDYVTDKLVVGKWVLLWIVLAECVSLCAAGALLWLRPEANPYADMTQEQVRSSMNRAACCAVMLDMG